MASAVLDHLSTYGPDRCERLDYAQASDYTRRLTASQYENFTVVSRLLPRRLRDDFAHVYAFCRWADDLGDETGDTRRGRELLDWWRRELDACYEGRPRHPVFVALAPTIERHDIPREPFDRLIDAFVQDQAVTRYDTWAQVLDYCTRSANPVGRLVLYLCGHRDAHRQQLSDATCTALQLANFWQDVRRDILERDRVYLPRDLAAAHGLDVDAMADTVRRGGDVASLQLPYRAAVKDAVDRTWPLFAEGRGLWPLVERDVRVDIQLFTLGGERVLRLIERQGYDTLTARPSLSKTTKAALLGRALWGKLWGKVIGRG